MNDKLFYQIKQTYGFQDDLIRRILKARSLVAEYKRLPASALLDFERRLRTLSDEDERLKLTLAWGRITLIVEGVDRSNLLY